MGVKVVGIDEVYTSKTCPKCLGHNVKQVPGHHRRVLRCKDCDTCFHCEVMASENYTLICRYLLNPMTQIPASMDRTKMSWMSTSVNVGGDKCVDVSKKTKAKDLA